MSQPSGPDEGTPAGGRPAGDEPAAADTPDDTGAGAAEQTAPEPEHEPVTEVIGPAPAERRFTAPSNFDAGETQRIDPPQDPATEIIATEPIAPRPVGPQVIPPREETPATQRRSWGWVIALVLVIAALVTLAILGTVLLTRDGGGGVSQEERVRETIRTFDTAIQTGDLATLRSITCGEQRDSYVAYDDKDWAETHRRVVAAKQYPVVASIDEVVVNGDHAEANVTAFIAYAPQIRSTRSFDLEYRDDQWKICQAPLN